MAIQANNLLETTEAASYVGLQAGTLVNWRCTKRHVIPFLKIGSKVRYRKSDLDAFLESRLQGTGETSE